MSRDHDGAFVIRRRAALTLLTILVPGVLAAAYAWLAWSRQEPALWAGAVVLLGVVVVALVSLGDLRSPVFVADEHGVRLREGRSWVGLLWEETSDIHVVGRSGFRDPHLVVVSAGGERRHHVPVGFTTTARPGEVRDELARRWGVDPY